MPTTDVTVMDVTALSEMTRSEIGQQIETARNHPRELSHFFERAESLACHSEAIAAKCFYKLKRAGKIIDGPSVRLAEICVNAWGNLRAGAQVIEEGDKYVTSRGVFHDLETNVAIYMDVRRRITDSNGNRYNDDMIVMTSNAANAIAFRNVAFKGIPSVYIQSLYEKVKRVAIGDAKTMEKRKADMFSAFKKIGVESKNILTWLGRSKESDIDLSDLEDLIGVFSAIESGDTTIAEQFPSGKPNTGRTTKVNRTDAKKQDDAQTSDTRTSEKPAGPQKPIPTKEEFEDKVNTGVASVLAGGKTMNDITMALVKSGHVGDPKLTKPAEYLSVLEVLDGMVLPFA